MSSYPEEKSAAALSILNSCGLELKDLALLADMPEELITAETLPHLLMHIKKTRKTGSQATSSRSSRGLPPRGRSPPRRASPNRRGSSPRRDSPPGRDSPPYSSFYQYSSSSYPSTHTHSTTVSYPSTSSRLSSSSYPGLVSYPTPLSSHQFAASTTSNSVLANQGQPVQYPLNPSFQSQPPPILPPRPRPPPPVPSRKVLLPTPAQLRAAAPPTSPSPQMPPFNPWVGQWGSPFSFNPLAVGAAASYAGAAVASFAASRFPIKQPEVPGPSHSGGPPAANRKPEVSNKCNALTPLKSAARDFYGEAPRRYPHKCSLCRVNAYHENVSSTPSSHVYFLLCK